MRETKVASRYAKSLLDLCIENGKQDECQKDMEFVSKTIEDNRELEVFLKSPVVTSDKKINALSQIFANLSEISKTFIEIITRKGREGMLGEIAEQYIAQYKVSKNILTAEIVSAVALKKDVKDKVIALIKSKHDGGIDLIEKVDSKLIGGLIIRVGDEQIDASISRKFSNLKNEFTHNPYVKEI